MKQVRQWVTIQPLAVGRAVRAINELTRHPRAGEGARGTPYASGKNATVAATESHRTDSPTPPDMRFFRIQRLNPTAYTVGNADGTHSP